MLNLRTTEFSRYSHSFTQLQMYTLAKITLELAAQSLNLRFSRITTSSWGQLTGVIERWPILDSGNAPWYGGCVLPHVFFKHPECSHPLQTKNLVTCAAKNLLKVACERACQEFWHLPFSHSKRPSKKVSWRVNPSSSWRSLLRGNTEH